MQRRLFLTTALAGLVTAAAGSSPFAATDFRELRIGYQKNGVLVIARQQAVIEKRLAPSGIKVPGIKVQWVEFSSGPPMMEAMNAGSIDLGQVGDTPPIFAQAAGANIVYVAGQPITNGQGILVRPDSGIRTLADLKGKRIGVARGSSAHNVTLIALEKAGLQYSDITPVYLNPPDAAAAFARGSIDAWAIWDPYFAIGEIKGGGRVLVQATEIGKTNSFYIANRDFATNQPQLLHQVLDVLSETASWAEAHRDQVGQLLSEVTGVDLATQTYAAQRTSFAIGKMTDDIVATQQAVADRFYRLGLIPRPVVVRDAVSAASQS